MFKKIKIEILILIIPKMKMFIQTIFGIEPKLSNIHY